jgi:RNA polymerase sigma factor (sigma-70 family)
MGKIRWRQINHELRELFPHINTGSASVVEWKALEGHLFTLSFLALDPGRVNFDDREDLVQTALAKLQNPKTVRKLCKFRNEGSPAHYLARMMLNDARKQQKRARLTVRALRRLGRDGVSEAKRSPRWIAKQNEMRANVREIASRVLSVVDCEILWLFYEDGLSTGEIAKKLNRSTNAVCKRLSRARAKIRAEIIE